MILFSCLVFILCTLLRLKVIYLTVHFDSGSHYHLLRVNRAFGRETHIYQVFTNILWQLFKGFRSGFIKF